MAKRSILSLVRRRRTASRGMRVVGPECLEPRAVLAVFTVVPPDAPTDYFHFRTLQDALGAASAGTPDQRDTIQIDPLADISSIPRSTGLLQSVSAGATQIQTPVAIAPGEVVTIKQFNLGVEGVSENALVIDSSAAPGGKFLLTLASPLTNAYSVVLLLSNVTVETTGDLGIGKSVRVTSTPGAVRGGTNGFANALQIWADNVSLEGLTIDGQVDLVKGADGTSIVNCILRENVSDTLATDSSGRLIRNNVFYGDLILRGDSTFPTPDSIKFNRFEDSRLLLDGADAAVVSSNTFNMTGAGVAVTVKAAQNVQLLNNTIQFSSPAGIQGGLSDPVTDASIGIKVQGVGVTQTNVTMSNNSIDTAGLGAGVVFVVTNGGVFQAVVQGNDFHTNLIGMFVQGDGTANASAAGTIDAGGGTLGSLGGNNFRGFTTADASSGTRYAIIVANTVGTAGTVKARNNIWSPTTPTQLVKDSANNTAAVSPNMVAGTGIADVGTAEQQLSGNQQYVQSLYNQFLLRTGTLTEINSWASLLPSSPSQAAMQPVATGIITSKQAYGNYVTGLYNVLLQRSPDSAGLNGWVSQLQAGATKESVAASITGSPEYLGKIRVSPQGGTQAVGGIGDSAYVVSVYQQYLRRLPSNSEVSAWLAGGPLTQTTRTSMANAVLASTEFRNYLITSQLYKRTLHRVTPPTSVEIAAWSNSGLPYTQLQTAFASTTEFYANG